MSSLSSYFNVISQFAPSNQEIARKFLENPLQDSQNLALDDFFGTKYLLKDGGEKTAFDEVGGCKIECVAPQIPTEEEYQKIFRNYKNYDLQDPILVEKWKEQHKKEIVPVITFLHLLKRIKASLIQACEDNASHKIRCLSQPLFFQERARFGIVSADRKEVYLKAIGPLFHKAISQLPASWDLLYLEAWAKELPPVEENYDGLVRVGRSLLTSAFVLNYTLMDELESLLEKEVFSPLDNIIGTLARTRNFYAVNPSCVYRVNQEFQQSQPIFSPINIQREAVNALSQAWDWKTFFGTIRFAASEDESPVHDIVKEMQKHWENALLYYRTVQDALLANKSSNETEYKQAEELRKSASSVLIVFKDLPQSPNCEVLSKLPKDWKFIYFKDQIARPSSELEDMTGVDAVAINYLAYKSIVSPKIAENV